MLRRLLRRAVTRARSAQGLAIGEPLLAGLADRAIGMFSEFHPGLAKQRDFIRQVLEQEESGFVATFESGLARLEQLLPRPGATISGEDAFALHDTYGFPIELTEEIARELGATVDRPGFERAMEAQRTRARAASRFAKSAEGERAAWNEATPGADSEFLGYDQLVYDDAILRRWRPHGAEELELVLDRTPAYAESGGQVADRGSIVAQGVKAELTHVYKEGEAIVHRVRMVEGERDALLAAGRGGGLRVAVERAHRLPTMRHHTATHLLHAALRAVLGDHVHQAGSLVAPDRLRFDYTHFEAPTREQLAEIERIVQEWALADREVRSTVMPLEEAKKLGAMALFGEKYGRNVRMVAVEGAEGTPASSLELCGGTHVSRTGEIGAFTLVSDAAIASGVRRIEALSGAEALRYFKAQGEALQRAAAALQSSPATLTDQIEKLKAENERLKKAQAEAERGGLAAEMDRLVKDATTAPGGRWVVAEIRSDADANALREAADTMRGRLGRGAALLALQGGDKLTFLAAVSDDLVAEKKLRADELVRAVAKVTGGSGGGKPHLALAGAKDPAKLDDALAEARRLLAEALGS